MRYAGSNGSSTNPTQWILKCTDLPQFDACQAQADLFRSDDKLHLRNLCNDTARCASLVSVHNSRASYKDNTRIQNATQNNNSNENANPSKSQHKMILDYSRQRVTGETMELLFDLADAVGLYTRYRGLATGSIINGTEQKPVLHHVLRMPAFYNLSLAPQPRLLRPESAASLSEKKQQQQSLADGGPALLKEIHTMRRRIQDLAYRVRSGETLSATGSPYVHIVVVATGGAHLGTECVAEALRWDPAAAAAAGPDRSLSFVSHADPVPLYERLRALNPCTTLVIVVSATFSTDDNPVMLNARTVVDWLVQGVRQKQQSDRSIHKSNKAVWSSKDIIAKQVLAVTLDKTVSIHRCQEFGVSKPNIFEIPSWINFRYSVCSAVGLLPLSLQYSYPVMSDFLDGAHDMDEHFFHAPLRDNIPVILGLLGVWNSTFLGYSSRATLPYCHSLHRFPAYVQNVDMESNGKRVAMDGTPLLHQSGEINLGDAGAQHLFFQLLHQGRVMPSDFIGFMESQQPADLPGEALSNHDDMMANFFAQPDALAYGKTLVDLIQDGTAEPLREHMVLSGNRPSSSLLMTRLDAFTMGQLIALYEHRTAVQGFVWGLNSFDQFGIELGSVLAKPVRAQLSASRKTGASVQGFNASTSNLLDHYLANGWHTSATSDRLDEVPVPLDS